MQSAERDAIFAVADLMAAAAKTAPKGSGRDTIVTAIVSGETKDQLREVPVFLMFQTLVSPLALRSVLPRIIGSITA